MVEFGNDCFEFLVVLPTLVRVCSQIHNVPYASYVKREPKRIVVVQKWFT
jgi:hypothetical protein